MSIKNLFGKGIKSYNSSSVYVESPEFINEEVKERETYIPPIDFTTASNFVKYGLAEVYYADSISRIYDNYPYDGSKAEIISYHRSSSYLDRWIYEEKYPKTTGYITMGTTGYQGGKDAAGYGLTSTDEYIRVWGGIHTASAGMSGKPLRETFDKSGRYDLDLNRTQNWRVNPISGSTVEFWLKIPDFDTTLTNQMVVVDVWNGIDPYGGSTSYARFQVRVEKASTDQNFFRLAYVNNGSGFNPLYISDALTDAHMAGWHHYAFTIIEDTAASKYDMRLYIDGALSKEQKLSVGFGSFPLPEFGGLLNTYLGALQATNVDSFSTVTPAGSGKLSGSLDEFRFWKKARTGQQIGLNWFRQIGGGANSDSNSSNKNLGVYFKFNEGITGYTGVDRKVLDYSGRIANGYWQGYTSSTQRNTGSAFASSSFAYVEEENPIIYSDHPKVVSLESEMAISGALHDNTVGSSIFRSLPQWMTNEDVEDGSGNLKNLTQIMASYFDTLHAQITALPNLKNKVYVQNEDKPLPFASHLLTDRGFVVRNLFVDAEIVNLFGDVDLNSIKFEQNLDRLRNLIYTNIYNNIEAIYKSKGTEKSIRNFIRCFGIDDEIIKLNAYTDGGIHYFTDKAKPSSVRKKYLNFKSAEYNSSTIFQTSSANNPYTFIWGRAATAELNNSAFTVEADVLFPYKKDTTDIGYLYTPFLSSSVFGFHEAREETPGNYMWATGSSGERETANLQIYLVRDELDSKNGKFVLKNTDGTINLTSSYFDNIYEDNRWNMAIRIKPDTYPYAGNVTNTTPTYTLDFYAVNYNFDELENVVHLTASLSNASGSAFLANAKRVYAGAHYSNFTGSVLTQSDIEIGAVRSWLDYIEDSSIQAHNKDPMNYGNSKAVRGSNIFTLTDKNIPSEDLTILNWEFDLVTGSSASGDFIIQDLTSGSTDVIYSTIIDAVIRRENRGKGYSFGANKSTFAENEFIYAQKKELPEISYTDDNIIIKTDREINFIKDDDVSDNFYTLEKSMNQIISEEMLKTFSTVHEFANLMGRPTDRYRMNYKRLEQARQDFFERVEETPDQERFIKFYKWIDGNISEMIRQLVPASVNFGSGATDVIESHILERNKYQRRVGLLDQLSSTEGIIRGVEELTYNWKFGHAPQGKLFATGVIGCAAGFNTPQIGDTVQVISTDGTTKVYTGAAAEDTAAREFLCGSGSDAAAASLANCINATAGHGGKIKATPGAYDGLARNLLLEQLQAGFAGNTVITPSNTTRLPSINFSGANDNVNCLWQKERRSRFGPDASYPSGSDQETLREIIINQTNATSSALSTVDKTIYQGSTFAARRLARPYKVGIGFGQRIHGGINYPRGKDREFYKSLITFGGGKNVGNAPENIFTVGITTGSSLIVQQRCDDIYNPNKKSYKFFECTAGKYATGVEGQLPKSTKEEYMYKLNSSMFWPFNLVSGTLTSGYNKRVSYWFNSSSIVTNVHSDTTDYTNTIPIQGPFTNAWVGGQQSRHVDLNKYDATLRGAGVAPPNGLQGLYTRPEAWRYLFGENPLNNPFSNADGAMGLTGPDYGAPYPDQTKKLAMWYREERAKRPVNVKNILTTTASAVQGNYQFPYEVISSFGMSDQRFRMREILLNPTEGLFGGVYSTLPQTTQPQSLMGAGTFLNQKAELSMVVGSNFRVGSNNGKTLTIFSPSGGKHVFTVDNTLAYASSTATRIGIQGAATTANAAQAVHISLKAAITAGSIRANLLPDTWSSETRFVLYSTEAECLEVLAGLDPIQANVLSLSVTEETVGSGHRFSKINQLTSQLSGATTHKSVIRTRFSAPGSPDTMSEDFLDVSSQEFSVYNAINYRNLSVRSSGSGEFGTVRVNSNLGKREGNRTLLARWLGKGGMDSQWGSISYEDSGSLDPKPAFYKQHRNTLLTPRVANTVMVKAISSPDSSTIAACYLYAGSVSTIPRTGPLSFSFWLKLNEVAGAGVERYIFSATGVMGSEIMYIKQSVGTLSLELTAIGGTNNWQWVYSTPYKDRWAFITITFGGNYNRDAILYIDGIEQTINTKVINSTGDAQRGYYQEIGLFDRVSAGLTTRELDGSLTDFAIWRSVLKSHQVRELYETNGQALGVATYSSLVEYWRLGEETALDAIAVGAPIPNGKIIPSDIGVTDLSARDNLTASVGPYTTPVAGDIDVHDNMHYNSLMPRSDFQYSWIRQSLSGSQWMSKQKVRGYAPKSGQMVIVGGGTLTKLESAISWPLISEIICDNCDDDSALITLTWDADSERNAGSTTSNDATTEWTVLGSGVNPAEDYEVAVNKLSDLVLSYTYSQECCDEVKYGMVVKGPLTGGGTKASYDSVVYDSSPRAFVTNNGAAVTFTHDALQDTPTQVKVVLTCDDAVAEMLITLKKVTIAIA